MTARVQAKQPPQPIMQQTAQQRPGVRFFLALLLLIMLGVGAWWAAGTQVLRCERTASLQVDCRVEQQIGPFAIQRAQLDNVVDATNEIKTETRLFNKRPREVVTSDMIVLIGANEQRLPALSGLQFDTLGGKRSVDFNGLNRFLGDPTQAAFSTWRSSTALLTVFGYLFLLVPTLFVVRLLFLLGRWVGRKLGGAPS